ncbi:MAG TPA: glycosyltransferase, partial [Streptosporangiaceae bacterium]|nr:glycosyltransferase [Streptosporangiaceae bacterium]
LTAAEIGPCLGAIRRLSAWRPASGQFAPVWDYPDRVSRYHAAGYLTDADRDALQRLLAMCDQVGEIGHGDPLPSNLLLTGDGGCALVDWEFTGTFLPGFDLAMLHTLLGTSTQITRGGICTLYRALAKRLDARGHEVTVITQDTPDPVRAPDAKLIVLRRTDDMTAHRRAVTAALTRIRPDVIDCSTWEAETLDYLQLPPQQRAPVVVRGDLSARTMGAPALAVAESDLVRRADRVLAVSAFASRDLAAAYGVPAPQVICNGVERDRFHPGPVFPPRSGYQITLDGGGQAIERNPLAGMLAGDFQLPPWAPHPAGRPQLAWVGKITPMKGWDRLETLARQLRDVARITVLLGHSRAWCPVTTDGRKGPVILQDLDDADLPGFYRAADWLLCTSRWEGFGLAIAEALGCGTPVLLPENLGAAPELLAAGGGRTYTGSDHLTQILATRPRPAGRLPIAFDWDANAEATLAVYQDLITAAAR